MPFDTAIIEVQRLQGIAATLGWELLTYTRSGDMVIVQLQKKVAPSQTLAGVPPEMAGAPEKVKVQP